MFLIIIINFRNIEVLMDIKNLTTFVHVAELGNFSRAGERLGYSQPSISVQIRQLEEDCASYGDEIGTASAMLSA